MGKCIKDTGNKTKCMVKEKLFGLIRDDMWGIIVMIRNKVKVRVIKNFLFLIYKGMFMWPSGKIYQG